MMNGTQFGNQIAEPQGSRFRQPDAADGYQPAKAREKYAQSEQVYERALLADRYASPQADESGGKVHTGHETVSVVQRWRCMGLPREKLQSTAQHCDRRNVGTGKL